MSENNKFLFNGGVAECPHCGEEFECDCGLLWDTAGDWMMVDDHIKIYEAMKCCGNCLKYKSTITGDLFTGCKINGTGHTHIDICDKWEMRK